MKILYLTNVPSPYRVLFFNELGKYCELTVIYQKSHSNERNDKWYEKMGKHYTSIVMHGISTGVDNAFCPEVIGYLNNNYDFVVICGIASPTEMFAIEWCKKHKKEYCIEGDGAFPKSGKGLKENLKKHFIKGAKLYFSTSDEHDKYYIFYGAPKEKIIRYPFTSMTASDILVTPVTQIEKMKIKKQLGILEEKVILAVGQFIPRKGFDVLLSIADNVDAGIYIVGGEPTEEYKLLKKDNVHFEGFKTKDELGEYYKAADVFVLPTREDIWGLVVNEAMAKGTPVVTTQRCIAGLEMVKNGITGYIVPVENTRSLLECINKVLINDFSMACLETARKYTIEQMVKVHMEAFCFYSANKTKDFQ